MTPPFHRALQRPLAMLCMALGLVVSAQAGVSNLERIAHAVDHHHAPSPVVGPVHYDDADHHLESVEHAPGDADLRPHHHHHYVDSQVALGGWQTDAAPALFRRAQPLAPRDSSRPPSGAREGPDRPPKPLAIQA